jgi:hypothetical protein
MGRRMGKQRRVLGQKTFRLFSQMARALEVSPDDLEEVITKPMDRARCGARLELFGKGPELPPVDFKLPRLPRLSNSARGSNRRSSHQR